MYSISIPFTDSHIVGQDKVRFSCPSGASLVLIEQSVTDGLAHYLSAGFYSPHTVKIWGKRRIRKNDEAKMDTSLQSSGLPV